MRRIFRLPWRTQVQIRRDLDEELEFHLDMRAAELSASLGLSPEDARREAVREFGDVGYTRRYCIDLDTGGERMTRRTEWLDDLRLDLRHAGRALRANRSFTAVALVTLALGIGATTAMYSVVERTLLARLPYADAERLLRIYGRNAVHPRGQIAAGDFLDFRATQRAFTGLAAFRWGGFTYSGSTEPRTLRGMRVSANMFDVLGARPLLGRTFAAGEDQPQSAPVVLLSHRTWRTVFGADPGIVGRTIVLSDQPRTVVGVMPPTFFIEDSDVDVWVPMELSTVLADANRVRKFRFLGMIGRLRPGVRAEQGEADLAAIAARLEREHPESNTGVSVVAIPIRESIFGQVRAPLLVLTGAAALVLLIACANVGSLLLARTVARRHELGIRAALGAGRGRIVRQLLTEMTVLAGIGGALGVVVAHWTARGFVAATGLVLPPAQRVSAFDPTVLAVALTTALATVLLFGVAPALAGSRLDLRDMLGDAGRGLTQARSRVRIRAALVASQAALAVVLLIGAGLLIRSLYHLQRVDLGFDPTHLLTFRVDLRGAKYQTREQGNQLFEALHERLRSIPGVVAASSTGAMLLRGSSSAGLAIKGRPVPEGRLPEIGYASVARGYFETMRIPLRAGRVFDRRDGPTSPDVVVISESVARQHWPGGDAVGAFVRLGPDPSEPWAEVIGVVGDVRQNGAAVDARPTAYTFALQDYWSGRDLLVRVRGDPSVVAAAARDAVRQLDPHLPVSRMQAMTEVADEILANRRAPMMLMSAFAALAVLLAAVGVYGVMSHLVTARTREFGVRMALGAPRGAVLRLVVGQGLATTGVGLAVGLAVAAATTRLLSGLLFGVRPLDPLTFSAVPAVLLIVGVVACWLPARRATRVDPMAALRTD
jgi:putative ABC transport system permease protein